MTLRALTASVFCYEGQSLVLQPTGGGFPVTVAAAFPGHLHETIAIGGTAYNQRLAMPSYRVDRFLDNVAGRSVLIDCGGTTDVKLNVAFSNAEDYWEARRAAGWDIIIATTVPDSSEFDAAADARRVVWNDAVEDAVGTLLDGFVDFRTVPALEDYTSGAFVNDYPGAEPDVYTHPSAATARDIMAPLVIAKVKSLW